MSENGNENKGTYFLSVSDRKRLVVSALIADAEKNGGNVSAKDFETAILNNVLHKDGNDLAQLTTMVTKRLMKIMEKGY